ncbi:UPF0691 protein C9orf116 homolog [Protopterus annectens]|uniref:UPF0691 protein C9orf116 homolog n=1 Tax=Protopterus annectens TaxID=7888 RepID=UPI001CFA80E5|nr:UPF0691 protein C9orf116 homolog [Protopterus annectens]
MDIEKAQGEATESAKTSPKTSDFYAVSGSLPERFNQPDCFQGYGTKSSNSLYRTTNQTYGSRAPTVHEMPTTFRGMSQTFTSHLGKFGMHRNNGFNTHTEKSYVSGPDNLITYHDRLNFHNCYNVSGPSFTA